MKCPSCGHAWGHRPTIRREGLTERQWEVADLIYEGLSDKQIADRLFITAKAVKWHVGVILKTWKLPNRRHVILKLSGLKVS